MASRAITISNRRSGTIDSSRRSGIIDSSRRSGIIDSSRRSGIIDFRTDLVVVGIRFMEEQASTYGVTITMPSEAAGDSAEGTSVLGQGKPGEVYLTVKILAR
jgi:hypothetical protein